MALNPDFHSASLKETLLCRRLVSRYMTETFLESNWNKELNVRITSFFNHHLFQVLYCAHHADPIDIFHVQFSHV